MIPFVRDFEFEYGRAASVSPLIRRVVARNPGPFTFTGTGTYIVGRGEVAVIDPGPDLDEHLQALVAALDGETVKAILVTHNHADHSPLARPLQGRLGGVIYGCPLDHTPTTASIQVEADHDLAFRPDVAVYGGEVIAGPGWALRVIATPGHTSNHVCFALDDERALFSGDHIMGWSTTVIAPPDGDMGDYFESLARIASEDFMTLWPTHGPPVTDPAPFIAAYRAHRRDRERQILGALEAGPATIGEIVPTLYAAIDARLYPAASLSVLAHLLHLAAQGRVGASETPPRLDSVFSRT